MIDKHHITRIVITFALVPMLFLLTACLYKPRKEEVQTKEEMETVMELIQNKDKSELKEHLSDYIKRTKDADAMIDELFDSIDGNIVSYDEPQNCYYTKEHANRGTILEYVSCPEVGNVKTDTGKTTRISDTAMSYGAMQSWSSVLVSVLKTRT